MHESPRIAWAYFQQLTTGFRGCRVETRLDAFAPRHTSARWRVRFVPTPSAKCAQAPKSVDTSVDAAGKNARATLHPNYRNETSTQKVPRDFECVIMLSRETTSIQARVLSAPGPVRARGGCPMARQRRSGQHSVFATDPDLTREREPPTGRLDVRHARRLPGFGDAEQPHRGGRNPLRDHAQTSRGRSKRGDGARGLELRVMAGDCPLSR
jgi:hypothetical protein